MSEEEINIILNTEDTFTRKGTDNEKGAGLGLVLTKNFIKRHHGRLAIESEIGKGTTFIVSLPAENKQ
jgi:signal transduction histidine kinase